MSPAVLPEATTAAVAIDAMDERHWDRVRAPAGAWEKLSFGPLKGQWRDVLFLERRSSRVGID